MFGDNDNAGDSFDFVRGEINPEGDPPDQRTRPFKAPPSQLKCPICDEETLTKAPFTSNEWACPCGYRETR